MRVVRSAVALLLLLSPVSADELTGHASVIAANTREIHGQRIRLHGIDVPEGRQTCELDGQPYARRGLWRGEFVSTWEWRRK